MIGVIFVFVTCFWFVDVFVHARALKNFCTQSRVGSISNSRRTGSGQGQPVGELGRVKVNQSADWVESRSTSWRTGSSQG